MIINTDYFNDNQFPSEDLNLYIQIICPDLW